MSDQIYYKIDDALFIFSRMSNFFSFVVYLLADIEKVARFMHLEA